MLQAHEVKLGHPDNILIAAHAVTNLPREQDDINTFFVPIFDQRPSSAESTKTSGNKKAKKGAKGDKDVDAAPSWMDHYDDSGWRRTTTRGGREEAQAFLGPRTCPSMRRSIP